MTQMNAEQLAAWARMPWASDLEEQEALSSPEYLDQFRGESFRIACHSKTAISMGAETLAAQPDIRSTGVTIPLSDPEPTLQQEAEKLGSLVGSMQIHSSKLNSSGRTPESDALLAFDEGGKRLTADAVAIETKVPAGFRYNGTAWVPK